MQLWRFYNYYTQVLEKLTRASFNQNAAKTAKQMIVVVARKDLWRKRVRSNVAFLKSQYGEKLPADYSKRKVCPQLLSENCTDSLF
jgi:hypothetical protein